MTSETTVEIERDIQQITISQLKSICDCLDTTYDELLKEKSRKSTSNFWDFLCNVSDMTYRLLILFFASQITTIIWVVIEVIFPIFISFRFILANCHFLESSKPVNIFFVLVVFCVLDLSYTTIRIIGNTVVTCPSTAY